MRPFLTVITCLAALVALAHPAGAHTTDAAAEAAIVAAPLFINQAADYGEDATPPAAEAEEPAPAEEEDPTLEGVMANIGQELSAEELAAVQAYDSAPDKSTFTWPTLLDDDDEEYSMAEDIVGYIQVYNDASGFTANNLWIMLAAMLVFMMHLGFATLEAGLTQAKNTTNILFKNTFIICIGILTYAICGFNLMYPGGDFTVFNFSTFGVGPGDVSDPMTFWSTMASGYGYPYTYWTDFFFQAMFAATAATIISGCVAERIKLAPFLIYATVFVGFVYPWLGSWKWGGGWLDQEGFVDYAGSTLVHSVGGWGGLAAILVLGPRRGKYVDGRIRPILPSNLPLATIGVFLLWFGWFGFNGGSALSAEGSEVSMVLVQTSIAAALGGIVAGLTSWVVGGKPDLTMALNGVLAGLVGITAGPDTTMMLTIVIGIVCGVAVYFSVLAFDAMKIDDPVGALSVHLTCGIIGTLFAAAVGGNIGVQFMGILAYGGVAFGLGLIIALAIKYTIGWRVSEEEEVEGLDAGEHGMSAYHGISVQ